MARLVFAEMKRQRVTYDELEWRSGVLRSTFKAWRSDNRPGLETIEAALGALGWALVPAPPLAQLSKTTLAKLEDVAAEFKTADQAMAAAVAMACGVDRAPHRPWPGRSPLGRKGRQPNSVSDQQPQQAEVTT